MIRKIIKFVERPFIEILLIFVITCFAFVVYVTYQQASRMGANEPQRSIVMDIAADLQNGKNLKDYTAGYIDISNNMAPFVIIYDKYGKVVAGNGYLDNAVPQVPIGVLATSDNHKENSVTWQPKTGVRIASVTVRSGDYYIMGGRSLFVVENHIETLGKWIISIWAITIIMILFFYRLLKNYSKLKLKINTNI